VPASGVRVELVASAGTTDAEGVTGLDGEASVDFHAPPDPQDVSVTVTCRHGDLRSESSCTVRVEAPITFSAAAAWPVPPTFVADPDGIVPLALDAEVTSVVRNGVPATAPRAVSVTGYRAHWLTFAARDVVRSLTPIPGTAPTTLTVPGVQLLDPADVPDLARGEDRSLGAVEVTFEVEPPIPAWDPPAQLVKDVTLSRSCLPCP